MHSPRYVILRHETPVDFSRPTHWDLMLETDFALRTWALADEPKQGTSTAAERLADHRCEYLDYEGPISRGRGVVSRFDRGTYRIVAESADVFQIELTGERGLAGVVLRRDGGGGDHLWIVAFAVA